MHGGTMPQKGSLTSRIAYFASRARSSIPRDALYRGPRDTPIVMKRDLSRRIATIRERTRAIVLYRGPLDLIAKLGGQYFPTISFKFRRE